VAVETQNEALVDAEDVAMPGAALWSRSGGARGRRRGWLIRRAFIAADAIGVFLAFALAVLIFSRRVGPTDAVSHRSEVLLFMVTIPAWIVLARLHGLYSRDEERASHGTVDDFFPVFQMITIGSFLFFFGAWVTALADPYPPKLLTFWVLAIAFVGGGRGLARALCRRSHAYVQNTVIVGAGSVGRLLASKLLSHPEFGINIVGFLDRNAGDGAEIIAGRRVLGTPAALPSIVESLDVERKMIASTDQPAAESYDLIRAARALNLQIDVVPRVFGAVNPSAEIYAVEGLPLIALPPARLAWSELAAKRAFDIAAAAAGLLLLAPVFALVAVRTKLDSRGPVFYRHRRVGLNGRTFRLVKFRTMHIESCVGEDYGGESAAKALEAVLADPAARGEFERTQKLEDDPRVTRFGRFLRKTSLDELPQLWNVLVGDMSLVGPRPVTQDELARYGDAVPTLLSFRPGVTGYWQINGRSRTLYEERVRLDLAYVRGWSLKLDVAIIGKTVWVLLKGHGAY
jgi:exopolysaccharide biosynthesis polyprenyl glycosylphosphotransferase